MSGSAPPAATSRARVEAVRTTLSALLSAERRLRGRDHQRAGELTYNQVRAIATLGSRPEMTAGEIARDSGLNPASVTALIDGLESAGFVERRRSLEDRRVCHVSLTEEGRELFARKLAAWQGRWQETLGEFSDEELEAARRVIDRVAGMIDSLGAKGE